MTTRPDEHALRFTVSKTLYRRIEDFRSANRPIPSIAEAVRLLIEAGLRAQEKETQE